MGHSLVTITLALDLGTQLGYAILRADGRIESGSVSFALRGKEGPGQRWVRFRSWLVETKNVHAIERVAYELVVGQMPGQVIASQIYGGFVAIAQHFAEHHGLPYEGTNVSTVKKRWTGSGNANKAAMIARCRELGFMPVDDNEADAIALLHVATGRVPPLPVEVQARCLQKRRKPAQDHATQPIQFNDPPF